MIIDSAVSLPPPGNKKSRVFFQERQIMHLAAMIALIRTISELKMDDELRSLMDAETR